jgi:hypothetical protein
MVATWTARSTSYPIALGRGYTVGDRGADCKWVVHYSSEGQESFSSPSPFGCGLVIASLQAAASHQRCSTITAGEITGRHTAYDLNYVVRSFSDPRTASLAFSSSSMATKNHRSSERSSATTCLVRNRTARPSVFYCMRAIDTLKLAVPLAIKTERSHVIASSDRTCTQPPAEMRRFARSATSNASFCQKLLPCTVQHLQPPPTS